jgi:hypothetical protein
MSRSFHDRLADLARPPESLKPDLPDMERRAGRRRGRKRLGSGVTAVVIAFAATAFLVRAFNQPSPQVPVGTPSPVPEHLQAQVIDQIDVGPFPQAIAVGEGGVWVDVPANAPGAVPEIVHIDPSSDRVVARIPVPEGESHIAAGQGSVWVSRAIRAQGGQLALQTLRIDPATDEIVSTIPDVGGQVAVGDGYLWSLAAGQGDSPTTTVLVKIDPDTGSIIGSQPLGATATNIVIGGGFVWLTTLPDPRIGNLQSGTLIQVDPSTLQVLHTLKVSGLSSSDAPVFADEMLWVPTCCINNKVSLARVDPATGETVGESVDVGDGLPFADAFGHLLLMSERGALSDLNPASGNVEALAKSEWPAAHGTTVFDPVSESVWVSNYQHTVTRIDLQPDLNTAQQTDASVSGSSTPTPASVGGGDVPTGPLDECALPALRPTTLPWLQPGEPIPPPEEVRQYKRLNWFAPKGTEWEGGYVSLRLLASQDVTTGDPAPPLPDGTPGYEIRNGDEWDLFYAESSTYCGAIAMYVNVPGRSADDARSAAEKIANSLASEA